MSCCIFHAKPSSQHWPLDLQLHFPTADESEREFACCGGVWWALTTWTVISVARVPSCPKVLAPAPISPGRTAKTPGIRRTRTANCNRFGWYPDKNTFVRAVSHKLSYWWWKSNRKIVLHQLISWFYRLRQQKNWDDCKKKADSLKTTLKLQF